MKSTTLRQAIVLALAMLCSAAMSPGRAQAAEEFERFLAALRARGMYDIALEYLEQARTNSLVDEVYKERILYEQGLILVDEAATIKDLDLKMQKLDQARAKLDGFINEQPQHEQVAMAATQLGNILVERARVHLARSKLPSRAAQKDDLMQQARTLLLDGQKVFADAEEEFVAKVETFPKGNIEDQKLADQRRRARLDLIQARLFSGRVLEEIADTYDEGTDERKDYLTQAATKYQEVYEKYRRWMAGLYARMYQGRCHWKLGGAQNVQLALGYWIELLEQPESPDFRPLKTKTLRLAMLGWTSETEKKYEEALNRATAWLEKARPDEEKSPEGLAIRWLSVVAIDVGIESLKADDQLEDDDPQIVKAKKTAAQHADFVAKWPSEYRQLAKDWLVANNIDLGKLNEIETFDDAYDAGRTQLGKMTSPKATAEERSQAQAKAMEIFSQSLLMTDEKTNVERLNQARYFLCYLYYQKNQFYKAAVLGEFLARKHKDSATARPASKLAMVAWLESYKALPEDQRDFENAKMVDIATYISETWPGQKEADEAVMILVNHFSTIGEIGPTLHYLSLIPEDSPRRPSADLKAGQSLWTKYLRSSRLAEGAPPQEELDELLAKAEETLVKGIGRMREGLGEDGEADYGLLAAELSLAQMYLDTSRPAEALAVLVKEGGVVLMVDAENPVTDRGNFRTETYKAALRAYIGTKDVGEAKEVMDKLNAVSDDEATLTKIYISLGRQLETQLELLRSQNNDTEADTVANAFESFLKEIAGRPGNSYGSLYWIASTFESLGEGLSGSSSTTKAEAYFSDAAKSYQKILDDQAAGTLQVKDPEKTVPALKLRLAECYRRGGQGDKAMDIIKKLLFKNQQSLDAQLAAARAFMAMGGDDRMNYLRAMNGSILVKKKNSPQRFNLVWGWNKMANILSKYPKFARIRYECEYNLVRSKYLYAVSFKDDKAKRAEQLKDAERLARVFHSRSPNMPEDFVALFNALLENVYTQLGKASKFEAEKLKVGANAGTAQAAAN